MFVVDKALGRSRATKIVMETKRILEEQMRLDDETTIVQGCISGGTRKRFNKPFKLDYYACCSSPSD